jgi:hypothetical protein
MTTAFGRRAQADRRNVRTVRSDDGLVAIRMLRTSSGVSVERVTQRANTERAVQVIAFSNARSLHRWCDADVARFDYPLLYSTLKRDADELFASEVEPHVAG